MRRLISAVGPTAVYLFLCINIINVRALYARSIVNIKFVNNEKDSSLDSIIKWIRTNGYDIANSLPSNFVTNGTRDYTSYIQDAINKHNVLIFPAFPLLINDNGLKLRSNSYIYFSNGSELILMPSRKKSYDIIRLQNVHDVLIIGPKIIGDRTTHLGKVGEWGMGIGIYSSKNIKIYNPYVKDCWGDGVYINDYNLGDISNNIFISGAICYDNRRNGISVISVDSLEIVAPVIANSNGTSPMCGIDIEPNYPRNELKHILIVNPKTILNRGFGISIALSRLYDKTQLHNIQIKVIHPIDSGSLDGFYVSCYKPTQENFWSRWSNLSGQIIIDSPIWKCSSRLPFNGYSFRGNDISLDIYNPQIIPLHSNVMDYQSSKKAIELSSSKHGNIIVNQLNVNGK